MRGSLTTYTLVGLRGLSVNIPVNLVKLWCLHLCFTIVFVKDEVLLIFVKDILRKCSYIWAFSSLFFSMFCSNGLML